MLWWESVSAMLGLGHRGERRLQANQRQASSVEKVENASSMNESRSKAQIKSTELRAQLLSDQTVQIILSGLTEGSVVDIDPTFDSDRMPRYLIVENVAKVGSAEARSLLEKMKDAEILSERFYERLILCPECKSPSEIFVRHKCPKCGGLELERISICEHSTCGSVWELRASIEQAACPKCHVGANSDRSAFRVIGITWFCGKCGVKFDRLDEAFFCRSCGRENHLGDVELLDVYSYSLNPSVKEEVQSALRLPILKKTFEECGLQVEMPGSLVGSSGVPQDFTIVAKKNDKCVAVDFVQAHEVADVPAVLASCAKLSDVKANVGLLLVVPALSDRARAFAIASRLAMIEGSDIGEVATKLRDFLKTV